MHRDLDAKPGDPLLSSCSAAIGVCQDILSCHQPEVILEKVQHLKPT